MHRHRAMRLLILEGQGLIMDRLICVSRWKKTTNAWLGSGFFGCFKVLKGFVYFLLVLSSSCLLNNVNSIHTASERASTFWT